MHGTPVTLPMHRVYGLTLDPKYRHRHQLHGSSVAVLMHENVELAAPHWASFACDAIAGQCWLQTELQMCKAVVGLHSQTVK